VTLSKKPVVDCSARAIRIHLDDDNVPVICPTCQTHFLLFKTFIRLAITSPKTEKPAAVVSATGSRHLRDDANVHLICPSRLGENSTELMYDSAYDESDVQARR
jgi:hypothetical protein